MSKTTTFKLLGLTAIAVALTACSGEAAKDAASAAKAKAAETATAAKDTAAAKASEAASAAKDKATEAAMAAKDKAGDADERKSLRFWR